MFNNVINNWFYDESVQPADMKLMTQTFLQLCFAANGGEPQAMGITPTINGNQINTTKGFVYFGETSDQTFIDNTGTNQLMAFVAPAATNMVGADCYLYIKPNIATDVNNRTTIVTGVLYTSTNANDEGIQLATIVNNVITIINSINPNGATNIQRGVISFALLNNLFARLAADNVFTGNNTFTGNNIWNGTNTFNDSVTLNAYSTYLGKEIATIQSRAGEVWVQSNITTGSFPTVYYGNGVWVAGGGGDRGIYYSFDGKIWTQSNITNGYSNTVYYGNGVWAASLSNGLYYSLDGKIWTISNITTGNFKTFYYGNGLWVAGSVSRNGLYYSLDGKIWTISNITTNDFNAVYYGNGVWTAASSNGLYYSLDGKIWTQSNINSYSDTVYYGNGVWTAASSNGLYYSLDGKIWTQSNITTGSFLPVYYGNGIWVTGSTNNRGLYYSLDGKIWTQSNITTGAFLTVYYGNGIWVTGDYTNGGLYYSLNMLSQVYYGYISDVLNNGFALSLNNNQRADLVSFQQSCLNVIENRLSDSELPIITTEINNLVQSFIIYKEAKEQLNDYAQLTLPFFYNQLTVEETNNLDNYLQELQLVVTEFGANQELPLEPDIPLLDSVI